MGTTVNKDGCEYFTKAGLKKRGWTDSLIQEFLPYPDMREKNPYHSHAEDMYLYKAYRVFSQESSDEFARAVKKLANRLEGAEKAVRTRRARQSALEEMG